MKPKNQQLITKDKPYRPGEMHRIRWQVGEICKANNCNPFQILAKIATGELKLTPEYEAEGRKSNLELQLMAAAELAPYLAPKLKSIEFKGSEENPIPIIINMGAETIAQIGQSMDE